MSKPLITGNIVKIWHGSRGHDYIVLAAEVGSSKRGLIKATCLNNDGTINKHTLAKMVRKANAGQLIFDKIVDINKEQITPTGMIRRINGTRMVAPGVVTQLLTSFQIGSQWEFVNKQTAIYPPLTALDARIATQY